MDFFKNLWRAATLTPPGLPRAPTTPQAVPSHRTQAAPSTSAIRRPTRDLANTSRTAGRTGRDTYSITREVSETSPDVSAAVSALLRTGIPERYTLVARDLDGQIDPAGTALAAELLRRLTFLGAVDGSYGAQQTLQSISESLGKELIYYGAAAVEVALDKARIPASLNPISVTQLVAYDEDNSTRWAQKLGSEEIDLDIPTFIYTSVDQLLTEAYSSGFIQAMAQPALADAEFSDDLRRVLKRAVHPRLLATIGTDLVKKNIPPEVLNDPEKLAAYQVALLAEVQNVVNSANPEDAFVSFDSVTYSYADGGHDPGAIVERIQSVLNGKLASGVKSLPVILGYGGSANSSSTESLLYLKSAGMLRRKLNEVYSRAFTVALRLSGVDGYCEFTYEDIDLRPRTELAAFVAMQTSNTLQLLSLGFLSDAEASIELTGRLPPPGFKPLSGTGFFNAPAAGAAGNPTSNTSAVERTLKPDTPAAAKGGQK
jgi:hypothetical protein